MFIRQYDRTIGLYGRDIAYFTNGDKVSKNSLFPASIYFRDDDYKWLHRYAEFLSLNKSRRVSVAEIVREAVTQFRKLHEGEMGARKSK